MSEELRDERGPKTPSENLRDTVELLKLLRSGVGLSVASNQTVVEALGYSGLSGTAKRKLAALNHFGLLERVGAGAYKISRLGKQLLMPTNSSEEITALAQAAQTPKLFRLLWDKFGDHTLPTLLPNILVREFGVLPQSSEGVAKTFRETAEFAGLLRNGVLLRTIELEEVEQNWESEPGGARQPEDASPVGTRDESGPKAVVGAAADTTREPRRTYTVALDAAGRMAHIDLEVPVRRRDLTSLRAWIDFMASVADESPE